MYLLESDLYEETNQKFVGYTQKIAKTRRNRQIEGRVKTASQVLFEEIESLFNECVESNSYQDKDITRLNKIGLIEVLIRADRGFFGEYISSDYEILLLDKANCLNIRKGELTENDLNIITIWQNTSKKEQVNSFIVHLYTLLVCRLYKDEESLFLMFKHACILLGFLHSPDPDWLLQSARISVSKSGGNAKAAKIKQCKTEFLRMVDEHTPAWIKTKEGLAEAILELKPAIVKYAKTDQNSVITAGTNLPKKWLEEHWELEKRAYKKTVTKQN